MISNFNFDILQIKKEYMSNQLITDQELLVSNMLEIQALIRILKRKGVTTEDEILKAVQKFKKEMENFIL